MSDRSRHRARQTQENRYAQLAFGFEANSPPGGIARPAAASPPRRPTLTEIFNWSAKQPVLHDASKGPDYQKQIDALRRQMSQPKNTYEMMPLGSINKAINRNRDRWLQQTIDALTELKNLQQCQQKTPKQRLGLAARAGEAKRDFNRAAKGIGM